MPETRKKKPRAGQEYERKADLCDHECASKEARFQTGCTRAAFLVQDARELDGPKMSEWNEPNQQANDERQPHGKQHNRRIEVNFRRTRNALGSSCHKGTEGERSEQQPDRAAGDREQRTFHDDVTHNPKSSRAKCQSSRELPLSDNRAREREIRDVDSANQQDTEGSAPQQIQRPLDASHQHVLQWLNMGVKPGVNHQVFPLRKALQVRSV